VAFTPHRPFSGGSSVGPTPVRPAPPMCWSARWADWGLLR
jgi:hypothetical protein